VKLLIQLVLLFHGVLGHWLVSMLSDGADKVAPKLELATPQLRFTEVYRGDASDDLTSRDALDGSHNLCWAVARDRVHEKMNVLLIGSDSEKQDLGTSLLAATSAAPAPLCPANLP
jgi:hypothetical protein